MDAEDKPSVEDVIEKIRRFVSMKAYQFSRTYMQSVEDLKQEAYFAIVRGYPAYVHTSEKSIMTYFGLISIRAMIGWCRRNAIVKTNVERSGTPLPRFSSGNAGLDMPKVVVKLSYRECQCFEDEFTVDQCLEGVKKLKPRNLRILKMWLHGAQYRKIAKKFNITHQRAQQIVVDSLSKIKDKHGDAICNLGCVCQNHEIRPSPMRAHLEVDHNALHDQVKALEEARAE